MLGNRMEGFGKKENKSKQIRFGGTELGCKSQNSMTLKPSHRTILTAFPTFWDTVSSLRETSPCFGALAGLLGRLFMIMGHQWVSCFVSTLWDTVMTSEHGPNNLDLSLTEPNGKSSMI